jgi:hypothetical protein
MIFDVLNYIMQMSQQWMYVDEKTSHYGPKKFSLCGSGKTNGMVLCVVHVLSVRIRMITLPRTPFTPTSFGPVSCLAIIVGPNTEKERL